MTTTILKRDTFGTIREHVFTQAGRTIRARMERVSAEDRKAQEHYPPQKPNGWLVSLAEMVNQQWLAWAQYSISETGIISNIVTYCGDEAAVTAAAVEARRHRFTAKRVSMAAKPCCQSGCCHLCRTVIAANARVKARKVRWPEKDGVML